MSHPFLAEVPIPEFPASAALNREVMAYLRGRDHRRWPGCGLGVSAWAFALEQDADAFVATFAEAFARRIAP